MVNAGKGAQIGVKCEDGIKIGNKRYTNHRTGTTLECPPIWGREKRGPLEGGGEAIKVSALNFDGCCKARCVSV